MVVAVVKEADTRGQCIGIGPVSPTPKLSRRDRVANYGFNVYGLSGV